MAVKESGMFRIQQTVGTVLCCKCGILMAPNAANTCVKCLRSDVDISEGLQKNVIIMYCPECNKSKELLTFCVKRLKNLNKVRLVHAEFIWTEPHSKRIKVKVRVQKQVLNGVVLEQAYLVEYVVQDHLCESCSRVAANPDQWIASVQLRQHVPHCRTFLYLEQLILKHDAALRAIKFKQMDHGIDLFFSNRSHALKFVDFVGKVCPIKSRNDKQLVSHDEKSSTYNYKYSFSVEICPICREDLIILPPKTARSLGNLGPLVLCTKVSDSIALLDPLTLRMSYMVADQYWKTPFKTLLSRTTYTLADVQVARVSDFGKNDMIFNIRTHLALLLNPGDYALGYDLYGANCNDIEIDKYKEELPRGETKKRGKPRALKLKSMNNELDNSNRKLDEEKMDTEYEESLYRNKEYQPSEMTDADDDGPLPLEQMLAGLQLGDEEADDDGPFPLDQMLACLELGDAEEEDNNNGKGMSD
ncbi:hypothetical protein MKW92_053655 [Papaver armeniacum]|nr:hypothetical protein MKW92_053655 [Papaver armeniacum]